MYMLPEGGAAGVVLYKASSFPLRWERESVLLNGSFADTGVVEWGGKWWLFTSPAVRAARWHALWGTLPLAAGADSCPALEPLNSCACLPPRRRLAWCRTPFRAR